VFDDQEVTLKKKVKKISLNRETLRSLDGQNLGEVVGGVTLGPACATKNPTICNVNSGCISCDNDCGPVTRTCAP
jgi:hypothetical protein